MAKINYQGILQALKAILDADSRTAGNIIDVEQDPQFGMGERSNKAAALSLVSRYSQDGQSLAAGTRHTYFVNISVWVYGFSVQSFEEAAKLRDDFMGDVELVLMSNRTLSANVTMVELEGGKFYSAKEDTPGGLVWVAVAEVNVKARVSATT